MNIDLNLGDTQLIINECENNNVSLEHAAYILATAYWETARTMKPVREAYWLSEEWRRKNLRYYPWYGRGYVQLTWEKNYKLAQEKLGVDLTSNPNSVMVPGVAAKILVVGSIEGWFTGKGLGDYSNYKDMRRVINGTDKSIEIAEIASDYEKSLTKSGYGKKPDQSKGLIDIIVAFIRGLMK